MDEKVQVPRQLIVELDRQIRRAEAVLARKQKRVDELKRAREKLEPDKPGNKRKRNDTT